ncbi:hypothetical protein GA0115246_111032 [Streptomyces sp. SolWspMP-sol7th]|nr:hypothetical protein GA0115246_111032 [Streptomyces sp. SolWspMP-sol7th]
MDGAVLAVDQPQPGRQVVPVGTEAEPARREHGRAVTGDGEAQFTGGVEGEAGGEGGVGGVAHGPGGGGGRRGGGGVGAAVEGAVVAASSPPLARADSVTPITARRNLSYLFRRMCVPFSCVVDQVNNNALFPKDFAHMPSELNTHVKELARTASTTDVFTGHGRGDQRSGGRPSRVMRHTVRHRIGRRGPHGLRTPSAKPPHQARRAEGEGVRRRVRRAQAPR